MVLSAYLRSRPQPKATNVTVRTERSIYLKKPTAPGAAARPTVMVLMITSADEYEETVKSYESVEAAFVKPVTKNLT